MEVFAGIILVAVVVLGVLAFVVSSWRRSERDRQRQQSRRGVDEPPEAEGDRGAYRSHWGGMGRPGGGR